MLDDRVDDGHNSAVDDGAIDSDAQRLMRERDAARLLLTQLWSSRTWRWTQPLRALLGWFGVGGIRVPGVAARGSSAVMGPDAVPDRALAGQGVPPEVCAAGDMDDGGPAQRAASTTAVVQAGEAASAPTVPRERAPPANATGVATPKVDPAHAPDALSDIVCFANIDWAARFQRPQQLMTQFARHGHRVFYVVPSRRPPEGEAYAVVEVAPNVFEVALQCPALQDCYHSVVSPATADAFLAALAALARDLRIVTALSTVHLPFWAPLTRLLRAARGWRIHYDCMDEWIDFPNIGAALLREEEVLVAEADLVTVTAAALMEKWSPLNPRCALVRNGVDFDYFAQACAPNDLLVLDGPVIGFYGALAEWVDFPLLAQLAARRPDWTFVLVGDVFVTDLAGLEALPNVMLTGRRPYQEMPKFLYRFDVCLIPFLQNTVTHAVDPVKFYEYVSAGKPVVSVPLDELQMHGELLYFASDVDGFVQQIERALDETDPLLMQRRVALARENDWRQRFAATREAIRDCHPRVSIIVVSWNHVEMTRDCLESIFRDTAYPNVEVIVVDNGSQDGSRNWLRWLARSRPELRVLLNAVNAGFAAANNQALRIATGEVLVLLNNDTVVPRSWLDPLLRALRDPGVGLVGPVTNSVGNEARIEIDYAAIEGMQEFVERRRATHAGLSFDITMLAMFCVALRRDTLQRVGLLDEAFGIGLFEDDDYSRRVQQCGLRTLCVEDAYVHHHGQASFKKLIAGGEYQQLWDRNQAYFEGKWGRWTAHAPRSPAAPPAVTAASDAERELTAERWSTNVAGSDAFSPEVYWLAVPAVQARHQRRGCGGGDHPDWVHYCLDAFLRDRRPVARMLSLGCGSGGLERQLARLDAFVACDAFDLADGALAIARREAAAIGAHHIDYRQVDIEQSDLPRAHYGAVWFNGSLHHIRELERVLGNVARSLEPDGWLFFNEYVGARHFGFGAAQRAAIERAFQAIPPHYRRSFAAGSRGEIQHAVPLPDPVEVRRVDPSEAVRSDEILRVVAEYFDIVACNPCGGSILQFALHGIAGNFRADDVASMQVLEQLFRTEDALIADGTLGSDFVVVAARAKAGHGAR